MILYGIKNCDTVKKARRWLDDHGVDYQFHDFREQGITKKLIEHWLKTVELDTLINKRSTTWKQLPESVRENFDRKSAIETALEQPTLIKRPVLDTGSTIHVGFKEATYNTLT